MNVIYTFGFGRDGQLGTKSEESLLQEDSVEVSELTISKEPIRVSQIACGSRHTLFLSVDGIVYSCGANESGQLGLGRKYQSTNKELHPLKVKDLKNMCVAQISAGNAHSLALTDCGHVFSWGSNSNGQLGHGNFIKIGGTMCNPMEVNISEVVQVICGGNFCMTLITDGSLHAWGENGTGQLGVGHRTDESKPQQIRSLVGVPLYQIAAGGNHACAVSESGAVFTWGSNVYGQLGAGDNTDRFYPCHVKSLRNLGVRYLACGDSHTAALTMDGRVFTFGADTYGQLGHGKRDNQSQPKQIFELMGSRVTRIACGRCHTVAIVGGKLYSFGLGSEGQLGQGKRTNFLIPTLVKLPIVAGAVFAGGDRSFVTIADNDEDGNKCLPGAPFSLGSIKRLKKEFIVQEICRSTISDSLFKCIEAVFSSSANLNCSFLRGNNAHFGASKSNCGVDMDAVMETFMKIKESQHVEQICRVTRKALEWSLFPELTSSPPDVEALRLYIILPWCPVFDSPESYKTVHVPFANSLISLNEIPSKVIGLWWDSFEIRHFSRILRIFKQVVSHVLTLPMPTDGDQTATAITLKERKTSLAACLKVLAKLSNANIRCHKIPFNMFYVNELADKVDIRQEYVRYVIGKEEDPDSLCAFPFIFNAEVKTTLLQTDAKVQMQGRVEEANRRNIASMLLLGLPPIDAPFLYITVARERIIEDTITQLAMATSNDLTKPLKVQFAGEEADDAGGVKKEFFLLLFQELLHPKFGMFTINTESQLLWFSTFELDGPGMYQLVGMLCGLAIYNGQLVNTSFPLALYKKLLKQPVSLDDLKDLSPTEGKSLESLLEYENDDFEDVFSLTFDTVISNFGSSETKELKPGGSEISVTKENRQEYVNLYVEYRLAKSVQMAFDAFADGFHRVVPSRILFFFQPEELKEMVVGNENYDWGEFEKNTQYHGEYWRYHPVVKIFWKVFHDLKEEEKKKFLLFLTGTDRIPLLGMSQLKMTIQPAQPEGYPVAHTCFNLLDLPKNEDEAILRKKILLAIEHNTGFSLV